MTRPEKSDPTPRACLACRSKHLKCDGQTPVCTRCLKSDISCVWVQSRRGYRNGLKKPAVAAAAGEAVESFGSTPLDDNLAWTHAIPQIPVPQYDPSVTENTTSVPPRVLHESEDEYLIDVYYQTIHPAHPFILPRRVYRQDRTVLPSYLRHAIYFIASHHCSVAFERFQRGAHAVFQATVPDDGFKVQTLVLLALTSYARFERDVGNKAITAAIDVTSRIGLCSDAFALNQSQVWQESWRRTWWELYTVTGLISLIGGFNFRLSFPVPMTLPTHCEDYGTREEFQLLNTEQLLQRFSHEESLEWSSFSYRIEAVRILCNVVNMVGDTSRSPCDAANASISSFLLSIPADKCEGLKKNGEVDEVMTCALMIIHLAAICLHLPRSKLADLGGYKTVCGTDRGKIGTEQLQTHRFAALRSAKALSNLISSRFSLRTLSPCFSCAIASAAVVQLSECLLIASPETKYLKEYIQLDLSVLNVLGETWPIARVVRGQIAQFSRETINMALQDTSIQALPLLADEQWLQDMMAENVDTLPGDGFALLEM